MHVSDLADSHTAWLQATASHEKYPSAAAPARHLAMTATDSPSQCQIYWREIEQNSEFAASTCPAHLGL